MDLTDLKLMLLLLLVMTPIMCETCYFSHLELIFSFIPAGTGAGGLCVLSQLEGEQERLIYLQSAGFNPPVEPRSGPSWPVRPTRQGRVDFPPLTALVGG